MKIMIFEVVYKLNLHFLFSLMDSISYWRVSPLSLKMWTNYWRQILRVLGMQTPVGAVRNEAIVSLAWPREILAFNSWPCNELCFCMSVALTVTIIKFLVYLWCYNKLAMTLLAVSPIFLPSNYFAKFHFCGYFSRNIFK